MANIWKENEYRAILVLAGEPGGCIISVQGMEASASDGSGIAVYDASGRLVAEGMGRVRLPVPGMYVVKAGNQAVKIAV